MVDEIELFVSKLEELLNFASSRSDESLRSLNKFLNTHFAKDREGDESKILRCFISRMSMETILQKAVQSEYSDTYLLILARVSKLPEFSGTILQRTELWKFVHDIAAHSPYNKHIWQTVLSLIVFTLTNSKRKYFEFVKKGMIFESMIMLVNKASKDEIMTENCKLWVSTSVGALLRINKINRKVVQYLQNNGIMENMHLLDDREDLKWILLCPDLSQYRYIPGKRHREVSREIVGAMLCHYCKKEETTRKLKCCERCKSAFYCNRKCQRKAWKTHKTYCKAAKSNRERNL